ncbi:MAG: aldehyde ferredoxin oxidoreductase [Firmicutes bacterium]|nr:aldehyde ferredoxin oxidoreductase [Bacillota bacterium]
MSKGYMGKFLTINLSTSETKEIDVPQWLQEEYVGGKGYAMKLLYDLLPQGADPLGPDNPLMFFPGPLTGTLAPSMRACVATKSPLTGLLLDSYFGGHFGPEIKYAGYDGIIITGSSIKPVYLWIDDNNVEIKSAEHLWGTGTLESNRAIKKELQDDSIKVSTIGPAGENKVRFALISCEYNRQAGRGGAGAVMGSKNLKAVAIRGTHGVEVENREEFLKAVQQGYQELKDSPDVQALVDTGTASAVPFANEVGLLPRRNYQDGTFDKADNISDLGQNKDYWLRSEACAGCPVRCSKVGYIRTGRYAGTISDIVEFESAGLLGSNLEIGDAKAVTYLSALCDNLGVDTISAGSVVGFALEAAEKDIIDKEKLPAGADFGNAKAIAELLKNIVTRNGAVADILADGVKMAAEKIGQDSDDFAVHVKGLEVPAWGPRGNPGIALALMTADRGGCHQRGLPLGYELAGEPWNGKVLDRLALEGKAEIMVHEQNHLTALDTFVKCDFGNFGISLSNYLKLFSSCTGRELTEEELYNLGAKIWNMGRLFNLREGLDPAEDKLPKRFMNESLPSGPCKGHHFTDDDVKLMLKEYYQLRGWGIDGRPTEETITKYNLHQENTFSID